MLRNTLFLTILLVFTLSCKKESANKAVGNSANDLLSNSKYSVLNVQISYMPGFKPDDVSLNNLRTFLNQYLNKSEINFSFQEIPASGKGTLTLDEIKDLEDKHRSAFNSGNTVTTHILVTDGKYAESENVLGIAYHNTSLCLFGKVIHENSGGLGQTSRVKLEGNVLHHEFGHIMGLVNVGSPMQSQHQDNAHGNHCTNTNCLMYYASETTDVLGILITGNVPDLDEACRNDLRANGGK